MLAIYYLQSILAARRAAVVALLHSALLSGLLLVLLPLAMEADGIWVAQPIAEGLTAALALYFAYRSRSALRDVRP